MDGIDDLMFVRVKKRDKEAFRYLYEHYFAKMVLFAERSALLLTSMSW